MKSLQEISNGKFTNLFSLVKNKDASIIIYRTSIDYNTKEEAEKYVAIIPDIRWEFVATIPSGLIASCKNFNFTLTNAI